MHFLWFVMGADTEWTIIGVASFLPCTPSSVSERRPMPLVVTFVFSHLHRSMLSKVVHFRES